MDFLVSVGVKVYMAIGCLSFFLYLNQFKALLGFCLFWQPVDFYYLFVLLYDFGE